MEDKLFFDVRRRIFKFKGANVFMFVGGRGTGKSTSLKKFLINECIASIRSNPEDKNKGISFVGCRRLSTQIKIQLKDGAKGFSNIECCHSGIFGTLYEKVQLKSGDYKTKCVSRIQIGYGATLGDPEVIKGGEGNHVKYFVFDEFIKEHGSYLANEDIRLQSTLNSIGRHKQDFKIFFLANQVSKNNPHFPDFGITKEKIPDNAGHVEVREKGVYFEIVLANENLKALQEESVVGRVQKDSDYGNYARGQGLDNDDKFIANVCPWSKSYRFDGVIYGKRLQVFYSQDKRKKIGIGNVSCDTGKTYYGTRMDAINEGAFYNDMEWFARELIGKGAKGNVLFEDYNVREVAREFLLKYKL